MVEPGGFCIGMVAGWAVAGTAGATIRGVIAVAGWAVAAAALLALYPVLPPMSLAAGAGVGVVGRLVLRGWAIRGGRA